MYEIALVAHLIGVVLGLGAATVSDIQFVKALKNETITKAEDNLLSGASLVIWIGIGIMLVSGAIMFAMNWDVLSGQTRMQAHVSIAAVIIANGLWLNISIGPKPFSSTKKSGIQKTNRLSANELQKDAARKNAMLRLFAADQ